jgi:hypothetical protein
MVRPAEAKFLDLQPQVEQAASEVFQHRGAGPAERLVTAYTNACLQRVDAAYGELVDFLTFKYLYSYPHVAPPPLPAVAEPPVPDRSLSRASGRPREDRPRACEEDER